MNFTGIKAVTFDAGGTLLEPWPSVGEVYAEVAAKFGLKGVSAAQLNSAFARAWKKKEQFDYSQTAWRKLVEECFCNVGPVSTELFNALYERFAQPAAWRVYDDVRPTLSELHRRGYCLGIISNWDERLRGLLDKLDLSRLLDAVVLSVKVGATKPSARIFQQAVASLDLQPGEVLHVGDSLEEDVQGAKRAGLQALLIDRRQKAVSGDRIATLNEILAMLN